MLDILPTTSPTLLLRYRDRQYAAELIATALLHFDFFSWLAENGGSLPTTIAKHFGWAHRPLDVLLTLGCACGLLSRDSRSGIHLTTQGREYLVKSSPWFLGPYYQPIRDTPIVQTFLRVLTTDQPGGWQAKSDHSDWHQSLLDPTFARSFTDLMNCRGTVFGQHLARALQPWLGDRRLLLDVGGGSGIYASTFVTAHAQAQAIVLEQSPVDDLVRQEVQRHGLQDRIQVVTGDMFSIDWPRCEILLLSNVLHDWDVPAARLLLAKASQALPIGGLLVIHDAFLSDDKTGPLPVAEYSALLMNITQGRCYSAAEYGEMMSDQGFQPGPYQPTLADRGFMVAHRA